MINAILGTILVLHALQYLRNASDDNEELYRRFMVLYVTRQQPGRDTTRRAADYMIAATYVWIAARLVGWL